MQVAGRLLAELGAAVTAVAPRYVDHLRAAAWGEGKTTAELEDLPSLLASADVVLCTPFEPGVRTERVLSTFPAIDTSVDHVKISQGLERVAKVMDRVTVIRSLTHPSNDHSAGHQIMLTGRTALPPGFSPNKPQRSDWPSIAAVANALVLRRNNLPPAAVLPERLIHWSGRVIPGQFGGQMGTLRDE